MADTSVQAPSAYPTAPLPSGSLIPATTSTIPSSKVPVATSNIFTSSKSTSSEHTTVITTQIKSTSSSVSSSATSLTSVSSSKPAATPGFSYTQILNGNGYGFLESQFDIAPFNQLCPYGDCYAACRNTTRLFQAIPSGVTQDVSSYGRHPVDNASALPDPTLFGICSNLATISYAVSSETGDNGLTAAKPYFLDTQLLTVTVKNVSTTIASCLAATCNQTRDSTQCESYCASSQLLSSDTTLSPLPVLHCLNKLCYNDCGLPYADKDVFGVGVLYSYIIQSVLVVILALAMISSAFWQTLRKPEKLPEINDRWRDSLASFLAAQCYFGISITIASFVMKPSRIDPLTGYALLAVSITCFLPPIFTLMCLHSHGVRSRYSTFLVLVNWIMSTILFFILLINLVSVNENPIRYDEALDSLFATSTCGGSSAMSLCQQTMGSDPLSYLNLFYNKQSIPNIKNIAMLWVWSTLVFICLVTEQLLLWYKTRENRHSFSTLRMPSFFKDNQGFLLAILLLIGTTLFSLGLAYQGEMVKVYKQMDVIDWDGWNFGQIVAILFWMPPLIEFVRQAALGEKSPYTARAVTRSATIATRNPSVIGKRIKRKPLAHQGGNPSTAQYRPLAHSPIPSPNLSQSSSIGAAGGSGGGSGYMSIPMQQQYGYGNGQALGGANNINNSSQFSSDPFQQQQQQQQPHSQLRRTQHSPGYHSP